MESAARKANIPGARENFRSESTLPVTWPPDLGQLGALTGRAKAIVKRSTRRRRRTTVSDRVVRWHRGWLLVVPLAGASADPWLRTIEVADASLPRSFPEPD